MEPEVREVRRTTHLLQGWPRSTWNDPVYIAASSSAGLRGGEHSESEENSEAARPHGARSLT